MTEENNISLSFKNALVSSKILDESDFEFNNITEKGISKIDSIQNLDVSNYEIYSLKGIKYFRSLRKLYCEKNKLNSIDVSKNRLLIFILCDDLDCLSLSLESKKNNIFIVMGNLQIGYLDYRKVPGICYLNCYDDGLCKKINDPSEVSEIIVENANQILIEDGNEITIEDADQININEVNKFYFSTKKILNFLLFGYLIYLIINLFMDNNKLFNKKVKKLSNSLLNTCKKFKLRLVTKIKKN